MVAWTENQNPPGGGGGGRRRGGRRRERERGQVGYGPINDITTVKVGRCKINAWLERKKWLLTQQDSNMVFGVSVVQDQKRPGHEMYLDQFTNLLMVNGPSSPSG